MIATQYHDEHIRLRIGYYAKVGGMSQQEAIMLQAIALKALNWNLFMSDEHYEQYRGAILQAL